MTSSPTMIREGTLRPDATRTVLRLKLGYCVGIGAMVPTFVAKEINAEVARRIAAGQRGHAGRGPVVSDVIREVLISWARTVRAARRKT